MNAAQRGSFVRFRKRAFGVVNAELLVDGLARPIELVLLRLDQVNGAALLGANMGDTVAHRAAANDGYNLDAHSI